MRRILGTVLSLVVASSLFVSPVTAEESQPVEQSSAAESATAKESLESQQSSGAKSDTSVSPGTSQTKKSRPRIGLALGGGGSRGAAHVGVLKVLLEEKIPIDLIAGTSIGSVVGGFYAAGVPLSELRALFEKKTFTKQFTPMPVLRLLTEPTEVTLRLFGYKPYDGLYHGWKFRKFANKTAGNKKIEELSIPFAAVVTDVVTGKSCRLTEGDLGEAMTASTAVPELRKPVQIGDKLYCDGGVINNIPVNHVREMGADFVIAVDIDEPLKEKPLKDFKGLGSMGRRALTIQLATFDAPSLKMADFCIHADTEGINLVSFKKKDGKRGIESGEAAARAVMPELKRKLAAIGIELADSKDSAK